MLKLNAVILFLLDFYIFFALRATNIRFVKTRWFTILWWGYSLSLLVGVFISFQYSIPLSIRSIILVAFFLTAVSTIVYAIVLIVDDLRRGGIWIGRLFCRGKDKDLEERLEALEEPLPEVPKKGISRSDFLLKSGIIVAALPMVPLAWGVISTAYDYRVRRQKLVLPNLPKEFHGMTIGQISDVHSGSFYNKKAVMGGVELLLAQKPDVIFFTGDLVNNVASEMRDYQDIFAHVKADLGVYSTLGNHDY